MKACASDGNAAAESMSRSSGVRSIGRSSSAPAAASTARELQSIVITLLIPCRPFVKPSCCSSACLAIAGVMVKLTAPASVLLSVFLHDNGLVSDAARFASTAESSSADPLAGKMPRESLNPWWNARKQLTQHSVKCPRSNGFCRTPAAVRDPIWSRGRMWGLLQEPLNHRLIRRTKR